MTEDKKPENRKKIVEEKTYEVSVKPVEYEAKNLFLKNLLNPEFVKKLTEGIGEFSVANISIFAEKHGELISLWHSSHEKAEEGIASVTCRKPELKDALFKAVEVSP
jgi:hypothetical protein